MSNPDALAVVIGVESYQYVPDATYAYNDARYSGNICQRHLA